MKAPLTVPRTNYGKRSQTNVNLFSFVFD